LLGYQTQIEIEIFLLTHDPSMKGSGGANQFTAFLRDELIPYVDSIYPTAPYKILVGHSLGGVLVINTLVHYPKIFSSYIAIDPSLWWDNKVMVSQLCLSVDTSDFSDEVLYMTSANLIRGVDSITILNDTTNITNGVRTNFEFYSLLDSTKSITGINSKFHYYPNETHPTLPLISIYDGFQYIFDFYKRPSFARVSDTTFHAKEILLDHYKKVSDKLGYKILPPDDLIDGIAFLYRINNMEQKANEILELKKLKENE
jgi:pimeloyl-ACP methyl ester carboxylesterase